MPTLASEVVVITLERECEIPFARPSTSGAEYNMPADIPLWLCMERVSFSVQTITFFQK